MHCSTNEELIKSLQEERRNYVNSNGKDFGTSIDSTERVGEFDGWDNVATEREQTWTEYADEIIEKFKSGRADGVGNSEEGTRNSTGKELVDSSFFDGDNDSQLSLSNQNTTPLNGTNGRDLMLNKAPLLNDTPKMVHRSTQYGLRKIGLHFQRNVVY